MSNQINEDNIIKDIRKLFRKNKKDDDIKDKIIRHIKTLFESDKESYYKLGRIGNGFDSNYIEYESNGDKNKTLSTEEYLDKIRPYLSNTINNLKNQSEWKIQLTVTVNFISFSVPCIHRVIT